MPLPLSKGKLQIGIKLLKKFNEATFAFACTQEVIRISPWWALNVPIIPSLQKEAKVGYDVRFNLPGTFLLYQFKLSSQVNKLRLVGDERANTTESRRLRELTTQGLDQFWTTPHQHQRLTRLSRYFPFTFYVAPKFNSESELNEHFRKKKVLANSLIVPVKDFPEARNDNGHRHRLIAPINSSEIFIFSEHKAVPQIDFKEFLKSIWEKWIEQEPLYKTIDHIWNEYPGIKGRTKRLFKVYKKSQDALPDIMETVVHALQISTGPQVSRIRTPPWPEGRIASSFIDGAADEYSIKLAVIAHIFSENGLHLNIIQPKERYID